MLSPGLQFMFNVSNISLRIGMIFSKGLLDGIIGWWEIVAIFGDTSTVCSFNLRLLGENNFFLQAQRRQMISKLHTFSRNVPSRSLM